MGVYPELFQPLLTRNLSLKNRIVYPPMATRYDITTERARAYYAERARGGVGLVVVEGTSVDNFGKPAYVAAIRPLAEEVHAAGARIALQLSVPPRGLDGAVIAPSATEQAREATTEDIRAVHGKLATAAAGVKEAGFDAVEIHGAHGYFVSQFFSPRSNRRTDRYGGSRERRMRFAVEAIGTVRAAVGPEYPLLFRLSAVEFRSDGVTLEDTEALVPELERAGVDVLDVSAGSGGQQPSETSPSATAPMATFAAYAAALRRRVSIPVIAVGRINRPEVAQDVLQRGQADLVAIGRQLLADPLWPLKVAEGREAEIVACASCNRGCLGSLERGEPIRCERNPRAGQEYL